MRSAARGLGITALVIRSNASKRHICHAIEPYPLDLLLSSCLILRRQLQGQSASAPCASAGTCTHLHARVPAKQPGVQCASAPSRATCFLFKHTLLKSPN
eukprot:776871-Pleurochrysis_carterae.AAC.2